MGFMGFFFLIGFIGRLFFDFIWFDNLGDIVRGEVVGGGGLMGFGELLFVKKKIFFLK